MTTQPTLVPDRRSPPSEARLAWAATILLSLHSCWVGFVGYRRLPELLSLHEGLGIQEPLPAIQAFFCSHPAVFFGMYLAIAAALVAKEVLMADKRRSTMITCLLAVFLLIVADVTRVMIVDPLFRLISLFG
jgi:hypothetical protein